MVFLQRVWSDIRRGENIDVYVTAALAVTLAILNVTGSADSKWIGPLTLTVLALLSVAILGSRHRVEQVHQDMLQASNKMLTTAQALVEQNGGGIDADRFFWKERVALDKYFSQARTIYVSGITLNRTLRDYSAIFERRLKAGARIQFIIIDPDSSATKQAVLRSKGVLYDSFYNDSINPTLNRISSISQIPNTSIELGLLPYIPSFGLILIDPDEPHGRILVEIYQHRTTEALHPTFELTPQRDARWYMSFREQFDALWDSCGSRKAAGKDILNIRGAQTPITPKA